MNMIEKVARAIQTADEQNGGWPYERVVQEKHARNDLFDRARAAIEAMRDELETHLKHDEEGVIDWIDAALLEHVPEHPS